MTGTAAGRVTRAIATVTAIATAVTAMGIVTGMGTATETGTHAAVVATATTIAGTWGCCVARCPVQHDVRSLFLA